LKESIILSRPCGTKKPGESFPGNLIAGLFSEVPTEYFLRKQWIPAFAGMTTWGRTVFMEYQENETTDSCFRRNDRQ
jgi:hypothetical protein